jgi:hypothetical protein
MAPAPVVAAVNGKHEVSLAPANDGMYENGHIMPTDEELLTLPRVAGRMPWSAYMLCGVEFAERASYCMSIIIRSPHASLMAHE